MRLFVKRIFYLSVLLLSCLTLFISKTFSDTLLDGVELESGYISYFKHDDWNTVSPGSQCDCCSNGRAGLWKGEGTEDFYVTLTYSGQSYYKVCYTDIVNSDRTALYMLYPPEGGYICTSCAQPFFYNSGEICSDYNEKFDTIFISAGSVTKRNYLNYPPNILNYYEMCSLPPPPSYRGYSILGEDSSYTFRIKCEGEKIATILRIEARVLIISEGEPSGKEFLINTISPFYTQKIGMGYSESERLYYWGGWLKWDIPIYKRCGESITVTPSLISGYGYTISYPDSLIKAIFDCPVDVNVPSVVMPKKTGNNVADVAVTLLTPAPSGGVDVRLTVEVVKNSGGHIEDGHTGSRPKGEITDDYDNKIDTITFTEGETQKMVKYKASEVSGEERIIAEIEGGGRCEGTINVKVPELTPLGAKQNLLPWGGTAEHKLGDNNYGTGYTLSAVYYAVGKYAKDYVLNTAPDVYLAVIDMSLPSGGLFDINGDWDTPHDWHRVGRSVDFSKYYKDSGGNNIQVVFYDEDGNVIKTTDLITDDDLDKYFAEKKYKCTRKEKSIGKIHYECPK